MHQAVLAPPPLPAVGRSTSGRCPRAALTPHSACYSTYLCCCPLPCFAFAVAARRHRWCCCVAAIVSVFSLFAALSCASAVVLRLARRRCRCTRPRAHHRFQERRRLTRCCPAHPLIRAVRRRRAPPRPCPRRQRPWCRASHSHFFAEKRKSGSAVCSKFTRCSSATAVGSGGTPQRGCP